MLKIGHRGAPGNDRYQENTLASFRKALLEGANAIEFDVRRCKDGIVVCHDENLKGLTNKDCFLKNLSWVELENFKINGEPIPTLRQVLANFGNRCVLDIELKERGLIKDVKDLIYEFKLGNSVMISSFYWNEVNEISQFGLSGGWIVDKEKLVSCTIKDVVPVARECHITALVIEKELLKTSEVVKAIHDAKLLVYVWTVDAVDEISFYKSLGVDGIISNFPSLL